MALFILGLMIFVGGHLFLATARGTRQGLVDRLGEMPFKGLVSLIFLLGLVITVIGWRMTSPAPLLYTPPEWLRPVNYLLVWAAFVLSTAAYVPAGRIAVAVKHPMVLGVKLWAFAHLLTNGELRSVLLFSVMLAWGVIDRIALKKRGDVGRPYQSATGDIVSVIGGSIGFAAVFLWLHPYIAGVAVS
ncbi:MAG: NnrU family protein [Pseudomonadota bacterium]